MRNKQTENRFLAQVATRKCHGLGSFNKRNSFLTAPEAEVWDQSASTGSSGESFLTGLQIAAFSPRPPKKEKARKEGGNGGKNKRSGISSYASTSISPCGPFPHDLI